MGVPGTVRVEGEETGARCDANTKRSVCRAENTWGSEAWAEPKEEVVAGQSGKERGSVGVYV